MTEANLKYKKPGPYKLQRMHDQSKKISCGKKHRLKISTYTPNSKEIWTGRSSASPIIKLKGKIKTSPVHRPQEELPVCFL